MAKPKRQCFGKGMGIHIGPCCDFWADDGMCVCNPVDAAEYPQDKRLYIAVNHRGFSRPNLRTIFPDGSDHVRTLNRRHHYSWAWWEWGSTAGKVTFELRDGSSVRSSRSTVITKPKPPDIKQGEIWCMKFDLRSAAEGVAPYKAKVRIQLGVNATREWTYSPGITINGKYIPLKAGFSQSINYNNPPTSGDAQVWSSGKGTKLQFVDITFDDPGTYQISAKYAYGCTPLTVVVSEPVFVCNEGARGGSKTCWDGSSIHTEICRNNAWVPSGESCPVEPAHGEKRFPTSCWDNSVIYAEKYDTTLHRWIPSGESCPALPATGEKRNPTPCWDGSIIHTETFNGTAWVPSGEACPAMPAAGAKRNPTTCWDGSIIHAEKFDTVSKTWIPTGEVCPAEPPVGAKRNPTTCWDGTTIYGEVFREGVWVSTGAKCPAMPTAGTKRNPTPCWDGTVIHTEIFSGGAWIPSGEKCPEKLVRHTLEIAVPKIAYEGQPVTIVGQAFCGAAASHDEDATLIIDGAAIETKKTKAGEVSFRWTAKGVGMRKVCISIPASPSCQVPITKCETMMVSAFVAGIQEQIKKEKKAYEERLGELKKRKKIAAGKARRPGVPGYVRIPATLAGSVINVGGVKVTVPPEGTTVPVPSGDSIVSVILEGIPTNVPVLVSPGEVINLPTGGLPGLPGGP